MQPSFACERSVYNVINILFNYYLYFLLLPPKESSKEKSPLHESH